MSPHGLSEFITDLNNDFVAGLAPSANGTVIMLRTSHQSNS
jgi:hypothetical protein